MDGKRGKQKIRREQTTTTEWPGDADQSAACMSMWTVLQTHSVMFVVRLKLRKSKLFYKKRSQSALWLTSTFCRPSSSSSSSLRLKIALCWMKNELQQSHKTGRWVKLQLPFFHLNVVGMNLLIILPPLALGIEKPPCGCRMRGHIGCGGKRPQTPLQLISS